MAKTSKVHKNQVILVAFDGKDAVVHEQVLSYVDYYEGLPELIDSNDFRASKGIRRVTGKIYDGEGVLDQSFDNHYSDRGEYLSSRVVHSDGTVIEN